jgi:hypothetical protein
VEWRDDIIGRYACIVPEDETWKDFSIKMKRATLCYTSSSSSRKN